MAKKHRNIKTVPLSIRDFDSRDTKPATITNTTYTCKKLLLFVQTKFGKINQKNYRPDQTSIPQF